MAGAEVVIGSRRHLIRFARALRVGTSHAVSMHRPPSQLTAGVLCPIAESSVRDTSQS